MFFFLIFILELILNKKFFPISIKKVFNNLLIEYFIQKNISLKIVNLKRCKISKKY